MVLSSGTNADVSECNFGSIQHLFFESYNLQRPMGSRLDRPSGRPLGFGTHSGRMQMQINRTALKFVSILLVLCVLSVGGLAQAQMVEHVGHHTHHQAATHGTVLCSWMCAAGTVLDTAVVPFQIELGPLALITSPDSAQPSMEACQTSSSRAPPSFSL